MDNGAISRRSGDGKKLTGKVKYISLVKLGVLCLMMTSLYWNEIVSLVNVWARELESSHGFLIPIVSVYVIWLKRDSLRLVPVQADLKGLLVLLAGVCMLALGYAGFEPFLRRISLIVTIAGLVYFLLGSHMLKTLSFPLGYLLFMIPPPYTLFKSVMTWLRPLDATVSYAIIRSLGMTIVREGPLFVLPNAELLVADMCTGILSLIAILAVAVLYAYLSQETATGRTLLVLIAIPVAIFGNIIRIVMVVTLVYFFGIGMMDSAIHQFQGIVNFTLALLMLILCGRLVKKLPG